MRRLYAAMIMLFLLSQARAQQAASAGGTVSGSVFCSDTSRPARFAPVVLVPASDPSSVTANIITAVTSAKPKTVVPEPTVTSAEGTFTFTDVPPGTYYLRVMFAGYLDPTSLFSKEDLQSADPDIHKQVLAAVPNITVTGNESLRLDTRLERTAAISGHVLYDDSSPASDWQIKAIPADPRSKTKIVGDGLFVVSTDDRGSFRLSNVPPGNYVVQATMHSTFIRGNSASMQARSFTTSVYSGSVTHFKEASPVSTISGEEHTIADIIVPLHSLHTITGHVSAQADGHAVTSGWVSISAADDPNLHMQTSLDNSGNFTFFYMPGKTTYTIYINGNESVPYAPGKAPAQLANGIPMRPAFEVRPYAEAKKEILLEDMDVTDITVQLQNRPTSPKP